MNKILQKIIGYSVDISQWYHKICACMIVAFIFILAWCKSRSLLIFCEDWPLGQGIANLSVTSPLLHCICMYICGVRSRKAGYRSILIKKVYGIETCSIGIVAYQREGKTMKPLHCFLSVVVKNEQLRDMGNRMVVGDGKITSADLSGRWCTKWETMQDARMDAQEQGTWRTRARHVCPWELGVRRYLHTACMCTYTVSSGQALPTWLLSSFKHGT